MEFARFQTSSVCRPDEIARYLDGELSSNQELEIESHISACNECLDELNRQKDLMRVLDTNFSINNVPELPKDFAQRVSVVAAADIGGIRSARERKTAFVISALLAIFAIAALGGKASGPIQSLSAVAEQVLAIFSAIGHFFYNLSIGVVTFLRPISDSFNFNALYWVLAVGILVMIVVWYNRRPKKLKLNRK